MGWSGSKGHKETRGAGPVAGAGEVPVGGPGAAAMRVTPRNEQVKFLGQKPTSGATPKGMKTSNGADD